jgi:hypothetical protein
LGLRAQPAKQIFNFILLLVYGILWGSPQAFGFSLGITGSGGASNFSVPVDQNLPYSGAYPGTVNYAGFNYGLGIPVGFVSLGPAEILGSLGYEGLSASAILDGTDDAGNKYKVTEKLTANMLAVGFGVGLKFSLIKIDLMFQYDLGLGATFSRAGSIPVGTEVLELEEKIKIAGFSRIRPGLNAFVTFAQKFGVGFFFDYFIGNGSFSVEDTKYKYKPSGLNVGAKFLVLFIAPKSSTKASKDAEGESKPENAKSGKEKKKTKPAKKNKKT